MGALRDRLVWLDGALADGPRRYLLMRPDVLMGALVRLSPSAQQEWLAAAAQATSVHGGESLRAYAQSAPGDAQALVRAVQAAAPDLGWGRWQLACGEGVLQLQVHASPFVAGWRQASGGAAAAWPLCAPVRGMLAALGSLVLQGEVHARELHCQACAQPQAPGGDAACHFEARQVG